MAKIQSTRSIDSESYDIWDAGNRSDIIHVQQVMVENRRLPLLPIRVTDVSRSDRRWFQHINYRYMALELILSGAVEYRTERQIQIATQGMLYVVAHGSNVRMVTAGNGYRRKLTLLICGSCLDSITGALGLEHDQLLKLSDFGAIERMMREIGKGIEEKKSQEYLSAKTYALLLALAAERACDPEELRPALEMIATSPAKKFSISELAGLCGISESTLRRRFSECFGLSPLQYLQERRLRLGAELLCRGNVRIKEVAVLCGFSTPLHFSLSFKARYGVSPVCFRKKYRQIQP